MSDPVKAPEPSPVDPAFAPITGGSKALSPGKMLLIAGVVMTGAVLLPRGFSAIMATFHHEPKQVAPQSYGSGTPYKPQALPLPEEGGAHVEQVVAKTGPVMPLESQRMGSAGAQSNPWLAARLADVGDVSGGSGVGPNQRGEGGQAMPVPPEAPEARSPLAAELHSTKFAESHAVELGNPRYRIDQGRILSCKQQTKINTSYPGGVTALLQEVRGETGDVVLLDEGSRVFGTIEHGIVNGLDRAFVVWQTITTPVLYGQDGTPHQLRVTVDSPAGDELGQGGLDGDVNRHVWRKLGGVIGLSLIQGGIQMGTAALANAGGRGNGSGSSFTNLNFQQGDQLASQLLASTINIPDVLTRDPGLPCSIVLVRDLVIDQYKLRVTR